jgi:hypothetical protein
MSPAPSPGDPHRARPLRRFCSQLRRVKRGPAEVHAFIDGQGTQDRVYVKVTEGGGYWRFRLDCGLANANDTPEGFASTFVRQGGTHVEGDTYRVMHDQRVIGAAMTPLQRELFEALRPWNTPRVLLAWKQAVEQHAEETQ